MIKWQLIYQKIARALYYHYIIHGFDSGHKLFLKAILDKNYLSLNRWLSNIDRSSQRPSIDPIMFFSAFNQNDQSQEERNKILYASLKLLNIKFSYKEIDLQNCPVPSSLKIKIARNAAIDAEIWDLFFGVITKGQKGLTLRRFSRFNSWPGLNIISVSYFLYWVKPRCFLPLSIQIIELLNTDNILNKIPKSLQEYMKALPLPKSLFYSEIVEFTLFPSRNSKSRQKEFYMRYRNFYKINHPVNRTSSKFRIIGLRTLPGLNKKYRKVLKNETLYQIYKSFIFHNDGTIEHNPENEPTLYDLAGLKIEISAIVGKNGSGKSALAELFLSALNNLCFEFLPKHPSQFIKLRKVNLDLFFYTDTIYKIEFREKRILFLKYIYNGKLYIASSHYLKKEEIDLSDLFYNIFINYSAHSLNAKDLGPWLTRLFEKNDSYVAPVNLNPYRVDGNIDINKEKEFAVSRLLAILLDVVEGGITANRELTDDGKIATHLTARINHAKTKLHLASSPYKEKIILDNILYHYKFNLTGFPDSIKKAGSLYLVNKLCKICTYEQFIQFADQNHKEPDIESIPNLLQYIDVNPSHITTKFKQAVYYFKFKTYKNIPLNRKTDINTYTLAILKTRNLRSENEKLINEELLPPAFFKFDIHLNSSIGFHTLSSGERQKIFALSTIIYHLKNLDSVSIELNSVFYRNVNIIFDEIELYFHPDMQRTFIESLYAYIKRAGLEKVSSLNICFITHSPFILSDILDYNTLFIEKGSPVIDPTNEQRTYGANIHDLLSHSFFLDKGLMGSHAEFTINSAIHFLEEYTLDFNFKDDSQFNWTLEKVKTFIERIGEPLIRESMRNLLPRSEYNSMTSKSLTDIESEINRLTLLKKQLYDSNSQ